MATTVEVTVGGLILLVNTFAIMVLYFVGNAILAPLLLFVSNFPINPALLANVQESTYIYPSIFGLMLIFEVLSIIGFVYILARRQDTPYDY